ncbi:Nudix hydrolase domain-containing protein [Balamuthia mandrillaris]
MEGRGGGGGGEGRSVAERLKQYVAAEITADVSHLTAGEKAALQKLGEAAKPLDALFMRQMWNDNEALLQRLQEDGAAGEVLHYYAINMGPWDRLDEDKPFIQGMGAKPKGANFYPEDMTKEEFDAWVHSGKLSKEEVDAAKGFYTVVRRDRTGNLVLVPYNEEYKQALAPIRDRLHEAADLLEEDAAKEGSSHNETLVRFLRSRADSLLSNNYFQSEKDWLAIAEESKFDVTFGPYEVYEDALYNYKASFEAFITVRDFEETKKLQAFRGWLQELENNLPVEDKYKNPNLGLSSPIVVVNQVLTAGDRAGPQTAAFNLPNDEQVVKAAGSKLVILKNVQEAKFKHILLPISDLILDKDQRNEVSFDAFFTHILAHEVSHSLGPHSITLVDEEGKSRESSVRRELQELHSAIEEAKADITSLYALQYLMDSGARVDPSTKRSLYITYLASAFRSIRFGLDEAHGKGQALQLNYILDCGGFAYDEDTETFRVCFDQIEEAVRGLTRDILTLQGDGDKAKAKSMLDRYGVYRSHTRRALDKLQEASIPVDIQPVFPLFQ